MTTPSLFIFLLACDTGPSTPKDSAEDHDQDSADTADSGVDSADTDCVPEAEVPYDGIDQDCSGADLTDVDNDGYDAAEVGGGDCLDTDNQVNPGATEVPYDGIDQDCSGADLLDADGDGHDTAEGGGDDCIDTDPSIHPGAADIPYDGVDQDCSGADLIDVDGDGHDATVAGGDDCLDTNATVYPGAPEVPYDGTDQDCTGADVVDADGDGYDAAEVGGDDCDDSDPTSHPGGAEVHLDSADNDCDGRVDEHLTCWDGTGDHVTVQEGVDGTPDGGTLEICSGTYVETVSIVDRVLTVEGDDPLGVLISWDFEGDWTRLIRVEGTSDVTLASLSLEANSYCLYYFTDTAPVRIDTVDFSLCDQPFESYTGAAGLDVENSYFAGSPDGGGAFVGASTFRGNIVDATGTEFGLGLSGSSNVIENNLFTGGTIGLGLGGADDRGSTVYASLINNTIVNTEFMNIFIYVLDGQIPPVIVTENNIVNNIRLSPDNDNQFYYVFWETDSSRYSVSPTASSNLLPDDESELAGVYNWSDTEWDWVLNEVLSTDAETALLHGGWRADPQFEVGSMGTYGLASTSPAVDVGTGDPDSDGSPADLGAFGGPNGDWWMEVPWPLP